MKKLVVFLLLITAIFIGGYMWLMSEGDPKNADQTSVTKPLPLAVGK